MRELALGETPRRCQVLCQVFRLLHRSDNRLIDSLLVSSLGLWQRLLGLGLAVLEELGFCRARLFGGGLGEICVREFSIELEI